MARYESHDKLQPGGMGIDRDRAKKIYRAQLITLAQTSSLLNETAQALQLTARNVTHPSEGRACLGAFLGMGAVRAPP